MAESGHVTVGASGDGHCQLQLLECNQRVNFTRSLVRWQVVAG